YHFVWATWNRESLLKDEIERHAYVLIREQCEKLKCTVHALGGIEDHVHLLVDLPRTITISDFMESVKGCSSRAINEAHETPTWSFKWQGGYGAITVSPSHKRLITNYIQNQRRHHADKTTWPESEISWHADDSGHTEPE